LKLNLSFYGFSSLYAKCKQQFSKKLVTGPKCPRRSPQSLGYNKTLICFESVGILGVCCCCCCEDGEGTSRRACQVLFVSSSFCLFHLYHYRICFWSLVLIIIVLVHLAIVSYYHSNISHLKKRDSNSFYSVYRLVLRKSIEINLMLEKL